MYQPKRKTVTTWQRIGRNRHVVTIAEKISPNPLADYLSLANVGMNGLAARAAMGIGQGPLAAQLNAMAQLSQGHCPCCGCMYVESLSQPSLFAGLFGNLGWYI